tara:strand:+ start:310 stop:705 length:396 start_codon:yes stop_codon:yes gene_type:complete
MTTRTNNPKWKRIVASVKAGSKGGPAGKWSARKAQLAVQRYKKSGGGYKGKKTGKESLSKWTKQKWRTGGGAKGKTSKESGGRYLPDKAWKSLSKGEKAAVNRSKKKGGGVGKTVKISKRISKKVAKYRKK